MTTHTKADTAVMVISSLVDNRKNYNEPTAQQVLAALMEIDPKARVCIGDEDGNKDNDGNCLVFTFSDDSIHIVGRPE